jgi:hypothetical protein
LKFQWPVSCVLSWARATPTSKAARKHAAAGAVAFAMKLKPFAIVSHLSNQVPRPLLFLRFRTRMAGCLALGITNEKSG